MPPFMWSTAGVQQAAIAADGNVDFIPSTDPLSHLELYIRCLNDTGTPTNMQQLAGLCDLVPLVQVLVDNNPVVSASLRDIVAFNAHYRGIDARQYHSSRVDNEARQLVVPIGFGRTFYDPAECLPATLPGKTIVRLQADIAVTGLDGLTFGLAQCTLPGASPGRFLAQLSNTSRVPAGTGNDPENFTLPIGNTMAAIMLRNPTVPTTTAQTFTIRQITLMMNEVAQYFSQVPAGYFGAMGLYNGFRETAYNQHIHGFVDAAAGQTDTQIENTIESFLNQYMLLRLDGGTPDDLGVDTSKLATFYLNLLFDVAEAFRIFTAQLITTRPV